MFLLHSLHPDDKETRVVRGLDSVRPYLKSHGGDCELVSVRDGIVRLKLHGTPAEVVRLLRSRSRQPEEGSVQNRSRYFAKLSPENAAAENSSASNLVVLK